MRHITIQLAASILFGIAQMGCDVVPYKEAYEIRNNPTDTTPEEIATRKVLIEDFTGHTCGNCPIAAKEAKRLEALYSGKVVVMGIHCTFFAKPKNLSSGAFKDDYRTPVGDALDAEFGIGNAGLPKGLINRGRFGKSTVDILNSDAWEPRVNEILSEPPIGIKLDLKPSFNTATGVLSVESEVLFQKPYEGLLKVAMYLTEDSIVSWQKYYGNTPEDIPNYMHMHVLRTDLLPASGTQSLNTTAALSVGSKFNGTWSVPVDTKIKIKNTQVIMIVYREDTKEIVQVGEEKVINN